eukprot:7757245-Pyramimonas_sp.AAC.1
MSEGVAENPETPCRRGAASPPSMKAATAAARRRRHHAAGGEVCPGQRESIGDPGALLHAKFERPVAVE